MPRTHIPTVGFLSPSSLRCRRYAFKTFSSNVASNHQSASAKLFEDAAREEAEQASSPRPQSKIPSLEGQHENWTGEESVHDAVLRMLVDKYKPLRGGNIRTAEDKLKQSAPQVQHRMASIEIEQQTWAQTPLLPAIDGHRPWHTTFKAPSHDSSSIRTGNFSPSSSRPPSGSISPEHGRTKPKERETKKRTEAAGRLTRARESTLDYRLGIRNSASGSGRINPVSLKGWRGLIEERIERARLAGYFNNVKGRGKPLVRETDERNPFIAREEFLMNRIVQRNGAAPPWVEVQAELESAVSSFREVVRQSWIRRAIRMLTMPHSAGLQPRLSLGDVTSIRDTEWEGREKPYHDTAIEELNSLVRKYNGLAPYSVRRPYYIRDVELRKVYNESGEDILRGIKGRMKEVAGLATDSESTPQTSSVGGDADYGPPLRFLDVLRRWFRKLTGW